MATLLAGALGVGVHYLASASGKVVEPILLGLFVFIQGYISFSLTFFLFNNKIYLSLILAIEILTNMTIFCCFSCSICINFHKIYSSSEG